MENLNLEYIIYILTSLVILIFLLFLRKSRKTIKSYKKDKERLKSELDKSVNENNAKNIVKSYIHLIDKYYEQDLSKSRITNRVTLFMSVVGLIAIVLGAIIGLGLHGVGNEIIGLLTSVSGLLIEFISAIFIYLNREVGKNIIENRKSLHNSMNVQIAISLAESLPEKEKNAELKEIIKLLLNNPDYQLIKP